jgi:hypothetical protein
MDLIFLHGPAAAGKLTTARALASLTGYPVFHNHLVVDALLAVFEFGSDEFVRLRDLFWIRTFAEAAAARRSLIFTFTPEDSVPEDFPARTRAIVDAAGGSVRFVALDVSEAEQEARIANADRTQFSKLADVETLRRIRRRTAASPVHRAPLPVDLRIDTDGSPALTSATTIVNAFSLQRVAHPIGFPPELGPAEEGIS